MSKIMIKLWALCIATSLLISCSSHNEYGNKVYSMAELMLREKLQQYERIVIIPGSGCTGCISQAEQYFAKNKTNNTTLFIFTNYYSLKNMILRLGGLENLTKENVYLDDGNTFYFQEYEEHIYPYCINVENNTVISTKPL